MSKEKNILYLGAAYYPEDWDESEQASDIVKMKEAGINIVRMGEFAWHNMEPREGEFDFEWLHRVVDRLGKAGIKTILGTPTATPPVWLTEKYPDMLLLDRQGRRQTHGGRRHCCSNNEQYRKYSKRIAVKMAGEFGSDPNVVGWQIDNEINGSECCCPVCVKKFHEYLEAKYGKIENLNRQWNLNLFSQAYSDFSQIPAPVVGWQNPHLLTEWDVFQGESQISFVHMQADAMRPCTDAPIGTDLMPINRADYEKMNEDLDVVEFNHYNEKENLNEADFWFDYIRPLKDRPFWNTETATCWNGSTAITQTIKPEGFCVVNSWLPVALGAEANLYWLWRTHWAGHELNHGSVLESSGRTMHIFGEVQEVAAGFRKAADFIQETKVQADVAVQFTSLNWNLSSVQQLVAKPGESRGLWNGYYMEKIMNMFYQPFQNAGTRVDVIGAGNDLSKYKLLVSGLMLTTEEKGMREHVAQWVRDGGVWLVGPMTDLRNSIGAHYTDRETGFLEELTGATLRYCIPDRDGMIESRWSDGTKFHGNEWYQLYENAGEPLVTVTGGHSAIIGKSVVAVRKVGKGAVILMGTFPCESDLKRIVEYALHLSGAFRLRTTGQVTVVPRKGKEREGLVLLETAHAPAFCEIPGRMTDILTGKEYSGKIELSPYQVLVLEKK